MDVFRKFGGGIPGRFRFDGTDESIPFAGIRLYVTRLLGVVIQRSAQFLNCAVQASLEVNEDIVAPEPLAQFIASHQFAGALEQEIEHLKRLARQPYSLIVFAELSPASVHHVRAEAN
jgi:hypothetical protein